MRNSEFQDWLGDVIDDAAFEYGQSVETGAWLVVVEWAKGEVPFVEHHSEDGSAADVIARAEQIAAICDVKRGACIIVTDVLGEDEEDERDR